MILVTGFLPLPYADMGGELPCLFFVAVGLAALGVFALACHTAGKTAQSVGGSYTVWFILTFFFGWFALLGAAILYMTKVGGHAVQVSERERKRRLGKVEPVRPRAQPLGASIEQPAYRQDQLVSRKQGYLPPPRMPQPVVAPVETPNPVTGGFSKCPGCGADNPGYVKTCWKCGVPLAEGV